MRAYDAADRRAVVVYTMLLQVFIALSVLIIIVALSWLRVKVAAGSTLKAMKGRILLITAHPDDECMFFAPTILSLGNSVRAELFLLCLSEGIQYIHSIRNVLPDITTLR